ncbi:hypothetical protein B296_00005899 [Ensete ventricosum]|uniref:Uncharacterized protein n=1 Tax=Ensete ventricosum TaxID=4639 RepID=A0A427AD15_ENSVE|nr:hypothetical protein B296_00005899 [Ensete ventricosum]
MSVATLLPSLIASCYCCNLPPLLNHCRQPPHPLTVALLSSSIAVASHSQRHQPSPSPMPLCSPARCPRRNPCRGRSDYCPSPPTTSIAFATRRCLPLPSLSNRPQPHLPQPLPLPNRLSFLLYRCCSCLICRLQPLRSVAISSLVLPPTPSSPSTHNSVTIAISPHRCHLSPVAIAIRHCLLFPAAFAAANPFFTATLFLHCCRPPPFEAPTVAPLPCRSLLLTRLPQQPLPLPAAASSCPTMSLRSSRTTSMT